jgi:hypothetical protein
MTEAHKKILFISGMFRSGTTLLGRMMDVHPQVCAASDPMRPMFNALRTSVAGGVVQGEDPFAPLGDYFFDASGLLEETLACDFKRELPVPTEDLAEVVRKRASGFSENWSQSAGFDGAHTFKEFFEAGLEHIDRVYCRDKDHPTMTAFKEVWCNEFVSAILREYPESKALLLVRDPRDVTASNTATGKRYPLFFLARQWRKAAFIAHYMKKANPKRVMLMRYEDLAAAPEDKVRELSDFLGIDYDERLCDLNYYRDGAGNPWKQNTNYAGRQTPMRINTGSIGKYRDMLKEDEIALLELVCGDWMRKYGYETQCSAQDTTARAAEDFPRIQEEEMAEWVRPFSFDHDAEAFSQQILLEKMRSALLSDTSQVSAREALQLQVEHEGVTAFFAGKGD